MAPLDFVARATKLESESPTYTSRRLLVHVRARRLQRLKAFRKESEEKATREGEGEHKPEEETREGERHTREDGAKARQEE